MPRATPFCFQTHPLFCILHLCSADTAQKRRVLGLWCDSYKIPRVPTANAMLYMKWHLAQEGNKKKKKKKKSTGLFFFTFQQRFFNWMHSALDRWLIYFPFQNVAFQGSVFISGEKTVRLLKENTSSNSGRVNALIGAGEGCRRLFQKLNYLRMLRDRVFLELSYQHTVMSTLNNW